MKNQTIRDILARTDIGATVTANGWVRTRRDSKGFSFIELNDGSCFGNIQAIVDDTPANYSDIAKLQPGSPARIAGHRSNPPRQRQSPKPGPRPQEHLPPSHRLRPEAVAVVVGRFHHRRFDG